MDYEVILQGFIDNIEAHARTGTHMSPWELAEMLQEMDTRWREVWTMMPRDQGFDSIYTAPRGDRPGWAPRPFLYRPVPDDMNTHAVISYEWERGSEHDMWMPYEGTAAIASWLIENPPFRELADIAMLCEDAKQVDREYSPWLLFTLMTGERQVQHTDEDVPYVVDLNGEYEIASFLPVGVNQAVVLSKALRAWGEYQETAEPYIHLLDVYSSF